LAPSQASPCTPAQAIERKLQIVKAAKSTIAALIHSPVGGAAGRRAINPPRSTRKKRAPEYHAVGA
jgi:hypothetical protein